MMKDHLKGMMKSGKLKAKRNYSNPNIVEVNGVLTRDSNYNDAGRKLIGTERDIQRRVDDISYRSEMETHRAFDAKGAVKHSESEYRAARPNQPGVESAPIEYDPKRLAVDANRKRIAAALKNRKNKK